MPINSVTRCRQANGAGMRFRYLIGASALAACANISVAQEPGRSVAIGPVPDWVVPSEPLPVPEDAQGAVFFRMQDTIVRLTEDGQRTYQMQILRILQPQALAAGNIALSWNPAAGEPVVHSVKIRRGARTIDVLESTTFAVLRREDQLEAAMLDGTLTATLQVPDLRVGDDLEVGYTLPSHDPTLGQTNYGMLYLGDAPPPGRFRLELSWAPDQTPITRIAPTIADVAQSGETAITLKFDNPDSHSPPRDAPPRYAWGRTLEYTDFESWQSVSQRFFALFDDASRMTEESLLRDEAALIAETHRSQEAQMQAALELVQQQVRYIYIGLDGGNFTPASADETWQRRYGDCKGKTAMLLALLRELGIEAQAVLVSNNTSTDGLDQRLPNPAHFDHVVVRATVDGQSYWLDGTLPPVYEGRADPLIRYQWVLPLSQTGSTIEQLPDAPYGLPQEMMLVDIDASAGFKQSGRLSVTTVSRGLGGLQEYMAFSATSANQLETGLRNELAGSAEWDTIESVRYRFDRATQASILTVTGTGPIEWEGKEGDYYLTLPGGGFIPPSRRVRPADSPPDVPFYKPHQYSCYVTTVKLPEATRMKDWSFNSTFDTDYFGESYYRMMELRNDRTMRMVSSKRVNATEQSIEQASRDNQRLDDFDDSMAFLEFDSFNGGWGDRVIVPVPAIGEFDWTGADALCLPQTESDGE